MGSNGVDEVVGELFGGDVEHLEVAVSAGVADGVDGPAKGRELEVADLVARNYAAFLRRDFPALPNSLVLEARGAPGGDHTHESRQHDDFAR